jgi:hypothetical protein
MQEANDPLTVMQKEELKIKDKLADVKAAQAETDAKYKEDRIALEAAKLANTTIQPSVVDPERFQ